LVSKARGRTRGGDLDVDPPDPPLARDPRHRARRAKGPSGGGMPRRPREPAASGLDPAGPPAHDRVPRPARRLAAPSPRMKLRNPGALVSVPDGRPVEEALARTTHLGIVAHPDDLEILAARGILECYKPADRWFCGIVITDGAGSARSGPYAGLDDAQ